MKRLFLISALLLLCSACTSKNTLPIRSSPDAKKSGSGVLFVQQTFSADSGPSATYSLFLWNEREKEPKNIATLTNNGNEPMEYFDGAVYFHRSGEGIVRYALRTGSSSLLPIPNAEWIEETASKTTIADFLITPRGMLFYLSGYCSEGNPCSLRSYDLRTGEQKVWIEQIKGSLEPQSLAGWGLDRFDMARNVLVAHEGAGDAGVGLADIYELSLASEVWKKVDEVRSETCWGDEENCPLKQKEENARYENALALPPVSCAPFTVLTQRGTDTLLVGQGGRERSFSDAKFLGCLQGAW